MYRAFPFPLRVFLCAALLWGGTAAASPQDAPPDANKTADEFAQRLRISILHPGESVVPGQPFALGVRIRVEETFLANEMVQLFRQELDLPVQVQAPWLEALPGLTIEAITESGNALTLVLGRTRVQGREGPPIEDDGHRYRSFDLLRAVMANDPAEYVLSAPILRAAVATEFRDELFAGRVPLDRRDIEVRGKGGRLVVEDFPTEGRPPVFVDAVGQFTLGASISNTELEAGQALALTLTLKGRGNLADLTPPRVDHLSGWRLQGTGVAREDDRLIVVATLVPLHGRVREVPPVEFAWYDPRFRNDPGQRYQTARTPAFPVTVREPHRPTAGAVDAAHPAEDRAASSRAHANRFLLIALGAGALGIILLTAVLLLRHRRAEDRPISSTARVRSALAAFEADPKLDSYTQHKALQGFLAQALGCGESDLGDRNLEQRLGAANVPSPLIRELKQALAEFDAANFGRGPAPQADIHALVRALGRALSARAR